MDFILMAVYGFVYVIVYLFWINSYSCGGHCIFLGLWDYRSGFGAFLTYYPVSVARVHSGKFRINLHRPTERSISNTYRRENADQDEPERKNLLSKGLFPTITLQDFPIRGHQVFLHIKRRRWLNTKTGKVVY